MKRRLITPVLSVFFIITGCISVPATTAHNNELPENLFKRGGFASFKSMIFPVMDNPEKWRHDLSEGLNNYKGKTLMLSSECSFIGYAYQQKYHRKLYPPDSRHLPLRATGHNMFTINPDPAVKITRDYLRQR